MINWNGSPTSEFDPRPAVANFFRNKDRRESRPTVDIYKNREFVKSFFKE